MQHTATGGLTSATPANRRNINDSALLSCGCAENDPRSYIRNIRTPLKSLGFSPAPRYSPPHLPHAQLGTLAPERRLPRASRL